LCSDLLLLSSLSLVYSSSFFFFHYSAPTQIYTLSLHDALPILLQFTTSLIARRRDRWTVDLGDHRRWPGVVVRYRDRLSRGGDEDRKSTRLNSSHVAISYAVFCLKKKNSKNSDVQYKTNVQ